MASAAPAALPQASFMTSDHRKGRLISIVEEEIQTEDFSPSVSPTPALAWRNVDYFDHKRVTKVNGLGVTSAANTGSPLVTALRSHSLGSSPNVALSGLSPTAWGFIPPRENGTRQASQLFAEPWNLGSNELPKLSSVIPDISDDEASRHGSIVELEIMLRKASVALSQAEGATETKSETDMSNEATDVLGPLHSPLTPLTPTIRTPLTPASPRASSECLGRTSINDDHSTGASTPNIQKSPLLDPSSVFKKINSFADFRSFSFGQGSKDRKEISEGQDPMSSPRMSREGSLRRPPSARLSLTSSVDSEAVRDVMLINPVTGERKMSSIRHSSSAEQLRRPSMLRRSSATSMYTLVRRDSLATGKSRKTSTASRLSISGRNPSAWSVNDQRHMSTMSTSGSTNFEQQARSYSASTRHMSGASSSRTRSSSRTMSRSSYARTTSTARTLSSSTWSRTMSTYSRASSMASVTTCDTEMSSNANQQTPDEHVDAKLGRKSSLLVPLFGNFQWRKADSAVHLPIEEPEPVYQEALPDVEEDPDFVEVAVEPKAGPVSRRASLIANIFTNSDVDLDPDLRFEPSASEAEIKRGITEAQLARSRRKMLYSRNVVATSLTAVNASCVALSFALFSVWYALFPLVLTAPLTRSFMAFDLLGRNICKRTKMSQTLEQEPKDPVIDFATVMTFSDQSLDNMESSLDSIVNQQGIDMHKNMLIISCGDQILSQNQTKSTTRVLLEQIFTNIVDEAKFKVPRDDEECILDNLWCRRGIYKGVPYTLMVQEGSTSKMETLGLIRSLLHSYNLRKESYHNSVPSAFFAWYKEWAELHDFASFDYLVDVNPETVLDENCISEQHRQCLKDENCVAVSSSVRVDPRAHKWNLGNLFENSCSMFDRLRHSHQTHVKHRKTASLGACQMLKICEATCGPQILDEQKNQRAIPMSNMAKQICSFVEEDDLMINLPSEVTTQQAVQAVAYARPSTTIFEFLSQRQRLAFSDCATNLAVLCNDHFNWFERLSSAAELLTWCLPALSLALTINFLRAAALQQNIPVLIVCSAIVATPWLHAFSSAMCLAHSWIERLRYLLGFFILIVTGPFIAIYSVACTALSLHRFRQNQRGSPRSHTITKTTASHV